MEQGRGGHEQSGVGGFSTHAIEAGGAVDACAYLALLKQLATLQGQTQATDEAALRGLFSLTRDPLRVIELRTSVAVVGAALWHRSFSTWYGTRGLFLDKLVVEESLRGKGGGRQLMSALAKEAHGVDASYIEWRCKADNPALQFYIHLGAQVRDDLVPFVAVAEALTVLRSAADADVHIRLAGPGDRELVDDLTREMAQEVVGASPAALPGHHGSSQQEPDLLVLLAEAGGCVLGMHVVRRTFHVQGCQLGLHGEDLYVRPHARRRGLTTPLLRSLGQLAVVYGASRVTLDARHVLRAHIERLGGRALDDWRVLRIKVAEFLDRPDGSQSKNG